MTSSEGKHINRGSFENESFQRRIKIMKNGLTFDPQDSDPLSSRMAHRFMFAEFLGSLFFGLISQGSVITSGALTFQFTYRGMYPGRLLAISLANAFAQTSILYAVLPYATHVGSKEEDHSQSGPDITELSIRRDQYVVGHFNPIVTLAMVLLKEIRVGQAVMFWVAQFFGFALASLLLINSVPDAENSLLGVPQKCEKCSSTNALFMEIILTFFMIWSCFIFMVRPPKGFVTEFRASLFGFFLVSSQFIGAGVSGACMNPARALGPALVSNHWEGIWVYIIGPIIGMGFGILVIYFETPETKQKNAMGDIVLTRFPVKYDHMETYHHMYPNRQ
jgi:aquaporin TIP